MAHLLLRSSTLVRPWAIKSNALRIDVPFWNRPAKFVLNVCPEAIFKTSAMVKALPHIQPAAPWLGLQPRPGLPLSILAPATATQFGGMEYPPLKSNEAFWPSPNNCTAKALSVEVVPLVFLPLKTNV